ncbi:MAG: ImmA/IrrE family metallo-endopeptidase [Prochlorothrix sp.]|nr:ImmA/IrrE family metallo-endopeptidase [Prochlorothrix sp.]
MTHPPPPPQAGLPTYRHPGQAFLNTDIPADPAAAVIAYSQFLRQAAGLTDTPPIALGPIYQHFGIPEPRRVPLTDQQGILVSGDRGLILIKEDDPWVRQRFTEGHELMELLFDSAGFQARTVQRPHFQGSQGGAIDPDWKERLCDQGAAHLLMPLGSFLPQLQGRGSSLATAQILAKHYQTSLLATLIHMVHHSSQPQALILWYPAHSHRDRHKTTTTGHLPPAKIRIRWQVTSPHWQGGFIPRNKSLAAVAPRSIVAHSHRDRQPAQGTALFHFGSQPCPCAVETLPLQIQGKNGVISLLTQANRRNVKT